MGLPPDLGASKLGFQLRLGKSSTSLGDLGQVSEPPPLYLWDEELESSLEFFFSFFKIFFLRRFYLFIFREGKGEREGEKH